MFIISIILITNYKHQCEKIKEGTLEINCLISLLFIFTYVHVHILISIGFQVCAYMFARLRECICMFCFAENFETGGGSGQGLGKTKCQNIIVYIP